MPPDSLLPSHNWADLIELALHPDARLPLHHRIYLTVRGAILSGRMPRGGKVPSTRDLARRLGVSRTSVVAAYDQLAIEGYLAGRSGSGSYVTDDLPEPLEGEAPKPVPRSSTSDAPRKLSARGQRHAEIGIPGIARPAIAFATGHCSVDARSFDQLRRLIGRHFATPDQMHLGYSDPRGLPSLRAGLAEYLRAARAVRCDPDQIVVTSGSQQAVDIAIRILLDPGDTAWLEDPCYPSTLGAVQSAGIAIQPVPVDEQGMIVSAGVAAAPQARVAFVTPSHQYPMGVGMSMARRTELLAWARETGGWIVEDDYDSEFRFAGRPLASLQGLQDESELSRVLYVGTLSKVLFPGLRLGYAVVPPDLMEAFVSARFLTDRNPPTLLHDAIAAFIDQGFLASHIRRLRQRYRAARDLLVAELTARLGNKADLLVPDQGMHIVLRLPPGDDDMDVAEAARNAGVLVKPMTPMYLDAPPVPGLMLGFTGYTDHEIRAGAAKLAKVLAERL